MLADPAWHSLFQMPQLAIVLGGLIPVVGIVAYYWFKGQKVRSENLLKRTMIERGMSADEIERVLAAHVPDPSEVCR